MCGQAQDLSLQSFFQMELMKPIHVVSVLVGAVAIAAIVWFVCRPREMDPVIIYKTTAIDAPQRAETQTTTYAEPRASKARALPQQQTRLPAAAVAEKPDPLQAALASPSYLEYSEKQAERLGFNVLLYWEFLEAAGITHNGRILQAEAFEKYFPDGGSYADYEPMMELAVAKMFLEDPSQSVMDVLQRFNATRSNRVWRFGYFNGYEGEYEWGQRIQRDAINIVANAARRQDPFEMPSPSVPEPLATEDFSTDVIEAVRPPEGSPSDTPEEMPSFAEIETLPESFETQFLEALETEIPAFPTDAGLETALRERFSPDRFGTAAETLRRYGPEEGLRRLRASDPEVATHIQRFLRRENIPAD